MNYFLCTAAVVLLFLIGIASTAGPDSLTVVQMADRLRAAGWKHVAATTARVLIGAALLVLADVFRLDGLAMVAAVVVVDALASHVELLGVEPTPDLNLAQ